MSVPSTASQTATPELSPSADTTLCRWEWLCIYFLSLGSSLYVSVSLLLSGYHPSPELAAQIAHASPDRYLLKILSSVATLLILYCLLIRRGQSLRFLGFMRPTWRDFLSGLLLAGVAFLASQAIRYASVYGAYYLSSGHFILATKSQNIAWLTGEGTRQHTFLLIASMAVLRVILIIVNPVHEEVIARAYTQIEWEKSFRWSPAVAAILSAVLQGTYHLYQGISSAIGVTASFLCFAAFFARERRILPVIVAHLLLDAMALIHYW